MDINGDCGDWFNNADSSGCGCQIGFSDVIRKTKQLFHASSLKRELGVLKGQDTAEIHQRTRDFINYLINNFDFESYINRPAESVQFSEQHEPQIVNKYEQTFYDVLDSNAVYRGYIKFGKFFQIASGRFSQVREYTKSILQQMITRNTGDVVKNTVQLNVNDSSIDQLREMISRNKETIKHNEWHISMHVEGYHYFLSIVKYGVDQRSIIFLVDSFNSGVRFVGDGSMVSVDAHFDLQNLGDNRESSEVVDYNCRLYSFELAKAAICYLQENDLSQLEQLCVAQDYVGAKNILHVGMKQYLPYYTFQQGDCMRKTRKEIERYHRDLRWKISGLSLISELKKIADPQPIAVLVA